MDQTIKMWDLNLQKSWFTFRGHVDSVNMAWWQPFSMLFASAGAEKIVSVWDVRTSLCVLNFYGHNNAVNSVSFNLKGDLLLTTDSDGIVKVWDIWMVKEVHSFDCGLASA